MFVGLAQGEKSYQLSAISYQLQDKPISNGMNLEPIADGAWSFQVRILK